MKISILIPAYNCSKTLKSCLDSILEQDFEDYEIVLVDDGSTDNTLDLIKEYAENYGCIRFLENDHLGIAETLNYGLYECLDSEYTVRIDSDDIMAPGRLKHQYEYMEKHPEIDILSGGMKTFGYYKIEIKPVEGEFVYTRDNLYSGLCHPAVIFRNNSIKKMDWFYSNYFMYAEDTEFFVRAQKEGLTLYREPKIVTYYRTSQENNKSKRQNESVNWIKNIYFPVKQVKHYKPEITAVINFKNEGNNVERTIMSIRATTYNMPVVVINDGSDDGYNYKERLEKYNVDYYENKESVGASKAREYGVTKVKTKYFVLLDGHMRFYTLGWDNMLKNVLRMYPESIVCTDSLILKKNSYDVFIENEGGEDNNYATYPDIKMNKTCEDYVAYFTHSGKLPMYEELIEEVGCVLGATYAMSRDWWNYIHGYKGLQHWGFEEPLISLKTKKLGGKCLLLHGAKIGHCYRQNSPYTKNLPWIEANRLYVAALFDDNFDRLIKEEKEERPGLYEQIMTIFSGYEEDIREEKEYIRQNLKG